MHIGFFVYTKVMNRLKSMRSSYESNMAVSLHAVKLQFNGLMARDIYCGTESVIHDDNVRTFKRTKTFDVFTRVTALDIFLFV